MSRSSAPVGPLALRAGLVDELHLVLRPVLLGTGEHLMQGLDLRALGYRRIHPAACCFLARYLIATSGGGRHIRLAPG